METPNEKISKLIKELGSQKAVADYLGYSAPYIGDVIKGRRDISSAFALRLGFKKIVTFEPLERP